MFCINVDGYHEVESIFASVDLADHLTFENLEEDIIRIETDSSFTRGSTESCLSSS